MEPKFKLMSSDGDNINGNVVKLSDELILENLKRVNQKTEDVRLENDFLFKIVTTSD